MSARRPLVIGLTVLVALVSLQAGSRALARPASDPALAGTQAPDQSGSQVSDEKVWTDFIAWFKTAPEGLDVFRLYGEALAKQGLGPDEIKRRFGVIVRLFAARPEGAEVFFDKTFNRPGLTGQPQIDGFASTPSEFLVGAIEKVRPGRALDLGMGQGRNAVALAAKGWTVTGVDVSGEAVAAAGRNADKAGVKITGIKSDYASYDLGRDAWDLVVMVFAWAPIDDPAFVDRVKASLKPGGLVILENFVSTPERPRPPMIHALPPGGTRAAFAGFEIVSYEELTGLADWGGPDSDMVRMVARKR